MEPTGIYHEIFRTRMSSYDQSPEMSTMVGPLFKRARLDNAQGTRLTSYRRPSATPFLAERLKTALHYTNDTVNFPSSGYSNPMVPTEGSPQLNVTSTRLNTARRREQCRINHARYRLKQDRKVQLLNETVLKLREEIPLLELQRDRILFGTKQSVFNVVVEYFHLFRHGIRLLHQALKSRPGSQDPQAQQQLVFLRSSMATNVDLGERRGLDALIEQWRRYSTYFEDLHFQLEHMEERTKHLIMVSASMSATITNTTLKRVFPHLVDTDLGGTLLGRRLMLPCSLWFEWDDTRGHIVRLEMSVDFLMPVSRVLRSLKDAAFVLGQAFITCDGSIGRFDM